MPPPGTCINLCYQDGSEGSPSNPAKFNNQDYAQLKDTCIQKSQPFVDRTFPPNSRSLGDLPDMPSWMKVEWLRPREILELQNIKDEPRFCMDGASRFDFSQGRLGNCWFLAAISSLTFQQEMMAQVVYVDQSFENHAGIFHFKFWRFGKWVDVVIDDFLPTFNNKLLFVKSKSGNEFWAPLLEKAYAKVCGSYADLNVGWESEALKDFSGGIALNYKMADYADEKLWQILRQATKCNSLICCGTDQTEEGEVNDVALSGLVYQHAYSVTGVTEVEYDGTTVNLVRIMNPWGQVEWNGKWSDSSDLWEKVSTADQEKCFQHNNGEFWMELKDFRQHFMDVSICCQTPNFTDGDFICQWKCMSYDGEWVAGASAGGRMFDGEFFAKNPQYRIQVTVIDKEDPKDENILLSLMQKPQHGNRKKIRLYPVTLDVFKVPPGTPKGHLGPGFFRRNGPVNSPQIYRRERDVIELLSLEPGEYVIVPSTYKRNMTADFNLTIYTKSDTKISVLVENTDDEENPDNTTKENEDEDPIRDLFSHFADQDGNLSARQLQQLLNDNFPHGFELETCRSMMAMVDNLFHQSDKNSNGSMSVSELKKALQTTGVKANSLLVKLLMFRYSGVSSTSLEDFIRLMLRLETMSSIFNERSSDGMIHLSWDELSYLFMYN